MINGKLTKRVKGFPQGSPLSPVLSNIMLHELDKYLEDQGIKYVRYADDFSLYTKNKTSARKIGNAVYLYLRNKLKLPINREKSGLRKPVQLEILGHRFVPTYEKGSQGKYQLVVKDKSWQNLKEGLKSITRKTTPVSIAQRIHKLKELGRGWINYFRMASIHANLKTSTDGCATGFVIASGMTGRNPGAGERTCNDLVSTRNILTHGAEQEWEGGQLRKVPFC